VNLSWSGGLVVRFGEWLRRKGKAMQADAEARDAGPKRSD
jgi:hypothetical protein